VEGNQWSIGKRLLEITNYGEKSLPSKYHEMPLTKDRSELSVSSAALGGYCKRFRRQCSGGKQRRPATQAILMKHSLTEITWRKNDAN
jgi:hypothetical protein